MLRAATPAVRTSPATLAAAFALMLALHPALAGGASRHERHVILTPEWVATTAEQPWRVTAVAPGDLQSAEEAQLELTGTRHQTMEGFGGCFNEAGWQALSWLSEEDRQAVIAALFDPEEGCRFNLCRLPIGANDYALEWYSLNETDGDLAMEHFSIERDRRFLIPYIKSALALRPDLKLFASPWSPPTWMKHPRAYNFGTLRWERPILEAYALYFLRFVQAYAEQGVRIDQIHVQNEPNSDQKFPSCLWTGEHMRDFIRDHLGPLFEREAPKTEIWVGTIEREEVNAWANLILSDPAARRRVSGVGYQWAGKGAVQRTRESWPDIRMLQTENECGDGQNSWDYALYVAGLMRHYLTNGVNGYVYWNMVLPKGGQSTWGWRQNAMVSIDPETRRASWNPELYVMKHLSRFVAPGAVRLGLSRFWAANALAFENPNGEVVLFVVNPFKDARALTLTDGPERFSVQLEARSLNTFVWKRSAHAR